MEKKALGKGLGALLPGHDPRASGLDQTIQMVPLTQILANQFPVSYTHLTLPTKA